MPRPPGVVTVVSLRRPGTGTSYQSSSSCCGDEDDDFGITLGIPGSVLGGAYGGYKLGEWISGDDDDGSD